MLDKCQTPKYGVTHSLGGKKTQAGLTTLQLVALLGRGSVPHGVEDTAIAPTERWRWLANLPTADIPELLKKKGKPQIDVFSQCRRSKIKSNIPSTGTPRSPSASPLKKISALASSLVSAGLT